MARVGPFETSPRLAAAVSGGADSLALALLADLWARGRGGDMLALIVDHGLRPGSADEAALTARRLRGRGISAEVIMLADLRRGPALAERARGARYAALTDRCAATGRLHLLLGHHAADQAETVAMRLLAGSHAHGLAAMPALSETRHVRLLRPLLAMPPARLRATLRQAGLAWIEDPSNRDPSALRARLRTARRDREGTGPATAAAVQSAARRGEARAGDERARAVWLARHVRLAPEGYARLSPEALKPDVADLASLARLIQAIGGADWPPAISEVRQFAGSARGATLGGARLLAGRDGWWLVREAAAMAGRVAAVGGATWDRRFRLIRAPSGLPGLEMGALGAPASGFRRQSRQPFAVLRTLPALWQRHKLVAVPFLRYYDDMMSGDVRILFTPQQPVAPATFLSP